MAAENSSTQRQTILDLLKKQGKATSAELNDICFRYSARIHELRQAGHVIVSRRIGKGLWEYAITT
jgi:hypothetical protein